MARPTASYRLLAIGEGPGAVGIVAASFALVPLFLAIPLGRLTDRRPRFPALVLGCVLQAVACGLLAVAASTFALAAASALLGLGHLGVALAVQDVIARESAAASHDQHFGLLTAGVAFGQLVGPLVAGSVIAADDLRGSTTHAFLAGAGLGVGATVFSVFADRGRRLRTSPPEGEVRSDTLLAILGTRGVPAGIFASIAVLSAADVFTAYLPVLGEQRGLAPGVVGALLAIRAGASMASRVGIGTIVGRVGRPRLMWGSAAVAAGAFAAMTSFEEVAVLGMLSAVAGFALGFGQPLSMTMVVQLVPERVRATALGVRLTGNRVGQVAAPAAAGLLAGSAGAASVFWLTSALLLASAVAVYRQTDVLAPAVEEA